MYFNDPFLYNLFTKKLNIIDKNSESKIVEGIVFNSLYRFINREKQLSEPKIKVGFYSGKKELMPGRKIKFIEFMPLSFKEFLISFGSDNRRRIYSVRGCHYL